jgi:poly(A) polymerase
MFDGQSLSFLFDEKVSDILHQLQINDVDGRLVGGCVRDAIVGKKVSDIDIAVNTSPTKVLEIFGNKEKYKVIPTGIDHGTVTVVLESQPFELTSLRRDIETDGRHALVSYTRNWEEDAARRDFTMNALYVSKSLEIFDYFGGVYDLTNGVIRFIGKPKDRINEDHLRILRYYRFFMNYGRVIDKNSEDAVGEAVLFLRNLSKERVQSELFKLLSVVDSANLPAINSSNESTDSNKLIYVLQKMSKQEFSTHY